ncbi:MAG TPA: zf-HC2 domain-containing protein [Pyrinomonadaceae bacterium]|nr:zf-HC2 domain-containing protein [Pyrinomonadaceae bacterium]
MKQETNNEIDLLLRRMVRRTDGGVSDPDGGHLDADELSSYAENALPAAARARYTEHLAQCSSCRTMVVQLSSAAGVVVAAERAVVPVPSGFRKFLASLLSPLVLRYAIPALGLAVIAVIGLTVLRPKQTADTDVAHRGSAPAPANEQSNAPPAQAREPLLRYDGKVEGANSAPAATPDAGRVNMSKAPASEPATTDSISAPVDEANAARADAAPPPKPAPPPITNAPAASATPVITTQSQAEPEKRLVERQAEANAYMVQKEERRGATTESAPANASAPKKKEGASVAGAEAGAGAALRRQEQREKDSDDSEIRSVAGRRFRKQRGVWVDTAYSSSNPTVNLTRGSEQYRALVADEPAIKNIADQLDGEIIVVWKGRAYRIR